MTPWTIGLALAVAYGGAPSVDPGPQLRPRAALHTPGPLIGEDKLRHLGMAFAVTQVGFGVARLGLPARDARTASLGLALVASIGKEVYDVRRGRAFSVGDLAWDFAGIALGSVLAHQIE